MRNCPNCRTDLRVNAKFCVRCGFNVSDYEQNAERKDFFCPECGVSFSAAYSAYYSKENEGKRARVICPHCSFDLTDDALIAYFGDTDSPDTPIKVLIDTPPVTEIGNELPDTPPTDQPVRTPPKGVMLIGRYPYEADGEVCALLWKVLTTTDEAALLIAERAIDSREYNEYFEDTTWEASGMRRWLNGEFIEKAFSPSEKDRIMSSRICTPDNGRSCGGGDTEDRIFLLSIDEAEKYFSSDLYRSAPPSRYAERNGAPKKGDCENTRWLLRSPGMAQDMVALIDEDGAIDTIGCDVNDTEVAVRPAMWVRY